MNTRINHHQCCNVKNIQDILQGCHPEAVRITLAAEKAIQYGYAR